MKGYRLIASKYPQINLFDDVVDAEDFEALYELQSLTNPRLQDEVGNISLISAEEIPYHCERGRSYAVAPFTHINRSGSRFADGSFGMLYIADNEQTAIAEVQHHQLKYWSNIDGLHYERFVFRTLLFTFDDENTLNVTDRAMTDPIYNDSNYSASQELGVSVRSNKELTGIFYNSVRNHGGVCWALSTPRVVNDVIQCYHLEMIWSGQNISNIKKIVSIN